MGQRHLYVIAGCNGAGKTTAAGRYLLSDLNCRHWVSDDDIAYGLSPLAPELVAARAGRMMLERIQELLSAGETFAIETTLAPRCFSRIVRQAQDMDYETHLLFFHLPSPQVAMARVAQRVSNGGRYVPDDVITRHYHTGLHNLRWLYMPIVDHWSLYTFNGDGYQLAATGKKGELLDIETLNR